MRGSAEDDQARVAMIRKDRAMTIDSATTLVQRAQEYLLPYAGAFRAPVIAEATGAVLRDTEGHDYLDFGSGQMAATVGHRHPAVTRAIERTAHMVVHL